MTLAEDATLASVRASATAAGYAFPVLDSAGRTVGVMSKTDFLKTVQRRLILVDHNEISQAVEGADQVEIIEIIDHHRIGSLTTHQPILFRNEPVGSTSTIVADCFLTSGVEIPRPIAGLLLAGLISDTLNLTSPTSTARDADVLRQLEKIADVQANHFKERFFAAGSLLTLKAAPQAITSRELDPKDMMIWGTRFPPSRPRKPARKRLTLCRRHGIWCVNELDTIRKRWPKVFWPTTSRQTARWFIPTAPRFLLSMGMERRSESMSSE